VKRLFKEYLPFCLMTIPLWTIAGFCYSFSQTYSSQRLEVRIDSIIQSLKRGDNPEDTRHIVQNNFVNEQKAEFVEGLLLHLSIAFFISGLLIIFVDASVRAMTKREFQRQTDEVSHAIWTAMLRRFVPEPIAKHLETVLKS
jgi:hypothetical protein